MHLTSGVFHACGRTLQQRGILSIPRLHPSGLATGIPFWHQCHCSSAQVWGTAGQIWTVCDYHRAHYPGHLDDVPLWVHLHSQVHTNHPNLTCSMTKAPLRTPNPMDRMLICLWRTPPSVPTRNHIHPHLHPIMVNTHHVPSHHPPTHHHSSLP